MVDKVLVYIVEETLNDLNVLLLEGGQRVQYRLVLSLNSRGVSQ